MSIKHLISLFWIFILALGFLSIAPVSAQTPCGKFSSMEGKDFWVTMLISHYEYNETGGQLLIEDEQLELFFAGLFGTLIKVENPLTGWLHTTTTDASGKARIPLPLGNTTYTARPVPEAYHITSNEPISVLSANCRIASSDASSILITRALGTRYVVQDYSDLDSNRFGPQVAILAVEDSTLISFQLPCDVIGSSLRAGQMVTQYLMSGEVYRLVAYGHDSFSGMEVYSNGKPFALFTGNTACKIPFDAGASDHLYEQVLPLSMWGGEFVLVPTIGRSGDRVDGDIVKVTAYQDCAVSLDGQELFTLAPRQSAEFALPPDTARLLSATAPVCVMQYITGFQYGGSPGDPASLTVVPIDKGVCRTRFVTFSYPSFPFDVHYVNVAVPTAAVDGMSLNGSSIANEFSPVDDQYSYARIALQEGIQTLENNMGSFVAHTYALGWRGSYAHSLGPEISISEERYDTVCQGTYYPTPLPGMPPDCTRNTGTVHYEYIDSSDLPYLYYSLWLTVLPSSKEERYCTINLGDTILFDGNVLTAPGDYCFGYTAANGCDSTIILHISVSQPIEDSKYNIWFPNVFTPDMETNNRFRGYLDFEPVKYELYIFDRWGNQIFSTSDTDATWDGTANGIPQPQAAYVYKYEVWLPNGSSRAAIGTVTLMR